MDGRAYKWRCRGCGRLLAVIYGDRVEIRLGGDRHRYWAALPVVSVCGTPSCGMTNEVRSLPEPLAQR